MLILTLGLWSNKTSNFCHPGYTSYPYFFKFFSRIIFRSLFLRLIDKKIAFKCQNFWEQANQFKTKMRMNFMCEWNLSALCLLLAIFANYLNYLVRGVLAQHFQTVFLSLAVLLQYLYPMWSTFLVSLHVWMFLLPCVSRY